MTPRTAFWTALLAYGVLTLTSAAGALRIASPGSVASVAAGVLLVASAGYALWRPDRAGGPDEWNLVVAAAVGGAVLYALGLLVGAL